MTKKNPPFNAPVKFLNALRSRRARQHFVFAWERDDSAAYRFEIPLPNGADGNLAVQHFCERAVKFVLWAGGGWRLHLAGPEAICAPIAAAYTLGGARQFDCEMMEKIYGRPLEVSLCAKPEEVPATCDAAHQTGISLDGCRIGFDLGASDYKIAAVQDGVVTFNDEFPWNPKTATDPEYHFTHLDEGLRKAATTLPRLDSIGGSTAGVVVENRLRIASLIRSIPADKIEVAQNIFRRIEEKWQVPVQVANDGDITALAAHIASGTTGVLGLAMGSSEAVGFLDKNGLLTGRLNELAFCPVDLDSTAPREEWSGDCGVGALYFSQQAVNRLISHYDLDVAPDLPLPEKLVEVQHRLKTGDQAVRSIYHSIGEHLGHSAAWYREFYDYSSMLVLGRVTTGEGGEIIFDTARAVLERDYPACPVSLDMPDEKSKRLGQSVAAAALTRKT